METNNLAIEYALKALKINKKNAFAYSTLADTYGRMGKEEEFFQNVEMALKYGFPVWDQIDEIPYIRYANHERFQNLLLRYQETVNNH
ncbi:MAG: hypothetical protein NW226_13495 [Microscillaceae bacterium]|nr:hypothetical protein [Microscillaceae bacterium]